MNNLIYSNEDKKEPEPDDAEVRRDLALAIEYLKEGKARFAPGTTNSLVDDLIGKYSR